MINLKQRTHQKELLDGDDISFDDIKRNMQELNVVNSMLGGHKITIAGINSLLGSLDDSPVHICEIGCGGGDNLAAIYKWCTKKNLTVTFLGVDIKQDCIHYAKQHYPHLPCIWVQNDYADVQFKSTPHIIFSSLFCHHFSEEHLIFMLKWMNKNSRAGFFINDLHRHPLAYFSIKVLTRLFSRSYLVKNDGPLSVARGFKKKEWEMLLSKAGITNYSIQWKWAFRYLIVCKKIADGI